jgi:hypothetical protein
MSSYTDEASIEKYLLTDIDASFRAQIAEWITEMSAYIDKYTGRQFVADATATARLFEGKCSNKLLIDDCVAVTAVEQGDTYGESFSTITAGDYQLLPYNDTPKNAIGLKRTAWGLGVHRITAKWGYSLACPDDIKFAATVLVSGIIWPQINPGSFKKKEAIGNYTVEYQSDESAADYERACEILDQYRRINL